MEELVVASVHGPVGHLELNRPGKLNALTLPMLQELHRVLHLWAEDPKIGLVLLTGRGERGFCAGGDIADFHAAITGGRHADFLELLALEFRTDHLISVYPKPLITLAHGITMGGGIGLASHAPVRLVTADAKLAMPEARIGYTPDVGGSHLLANAPGHFGEYFAMTATSFSGADAVFLGFADAVISESLAASIVDELDDLIGLGAAEIAAAFEVLHAVPESRRLEIEQGWIDYAFGAESPDAVLERLQSMVHPGARRAAEMISANSPTSVAAAFHAVRAARAEQNLRGALDRELRLAAHLMHQPDLAEGIRAQVIDKDRNPSWQPAAPGEVNAAALLALMGE
ncbi:enoyl-CoA hydratase/isomerase family protein [Glutamicibacter sp. AOP12-B1-11]|uniref:enoyl-CoA hydratase/isomerase family protein n=1 Tax=Micrococcaceae TaxID=1268 RepID=UPI00215857BC|nr:MULTISPECIES: enoyl-CoA hydratase/isomerase family protein [unclassified Arthrobacter]